MRKSICILFILLVSTSLWANEKTEKHIYIVDLRFNFPRNHN